MPDRFLGGSICASIRLPGGILQCHFCQFPVHPQNHIHFTGLGPAWDEFYRHSGGGKSLAGRELHFQRRGRLERDECAAARLQRQAGIQPRRNRAGGQRPQKTPCQRHGLARRAFGRARIAGGDTLGCFGARDVECRFSSPDYRVGTEQRHQPRAACGTAGGDPWRHPRSGGERLFPVRCAQGSAVNF